MGEILVWELFLAPRAPLPIRKTKAFAPSSPLYHQRLPKYQSLETASRSGEPKVLFHCFSQGQSGLILKAGEGDEMNERLC